MTTRTEPAPNSWANRPVFTEKPFLHAAPYVALLAYGLILLIPGVVPVGTCDSAAVGQDAFLAGAGAASAAITVLFLISAAVAHGQQRGVGSDGALATVAAGLAACFALAAALAMVGIGAPVIYLMVLVMFALPITATLCLVAGVATAVGLVRDASRGRYVAIESAAWVCAFLVLPVITGLAYLTTSPLCFD
jgi:hypothetical protein